MEITGAVPEKEITLQGEFIYPDIDQAGDFSCSNTLFNQIHEIVLQAILQIARTGKSWAGWSRHT